MADEESRNLRANLPSADLALLPVADAVLTRHADRGDITLDFPSSTHIAGCRCPGPFVDP